MKKIFIFILLFCLILSGCKDTKSPAQTIAEIPVNDIVINKSHIYVNEGEKTVLLAQVFPFNADNQKINWKSDNENIAFVDDGIVVGKSEGRTVVTATSEDGEISANCIVFVSTPKLDYNKYQNNLNTKNQSAEFINKINEDYKNGDYLKSKLELINQTIKEIESLLNDNFNIELKLLKEKLENIKIKTINKPEDLNSENKNYFYAYQYFYNSLGITENEDENTIYKDDNTIIKEKFMQY